MDLNDLDALRADAMRAMLTEDGRGEVWLYDVIEARQGFQAALEDQDFDNIQRDGDAVRRGVPYCLVGPGICDQPFTTPGELLGLIHWLCCEGYLSCYQQEPWRWQPHLDETKAAIARWREAT